MSIVSDSSTLDYSCPIIGGDTVWEGEEAPTLGWEHGLAQVGMWLDLYEVPANPLALTDAFKSGNAEFLRELAQTDDGTLSLGASSKKYFRSIFHITSRLSYLAERNLSNMSHTVLSVNPNDVVANIAGLYNHVIAPGFDPGTGYKGSTLADVVLPGDVQSTPVVRLAGGVNLLRYPSPTGMANHDEFFLGSLMSNKRPPKMPALELHVGDYGVNPAVYTIVNARDASVLPGYQLAKVGKTDNVKQRRANHDSNAPGLSKSIMLVRPEKYTLESLEAMLLATLSPWLHHGREHFNLPYTVRYMLSITRSETQLVRLCAALSTPTGRSMINVLEQTLVSGQVTRTHEGRQVAILEGDTVHQEVALSNQHN